ncbi:hypothetical protein ACN28C_05205 [Plantactinospora sp. WMMC1484]|uniref:hypothetical protein n=1 Tax=Plantactinospora sp. WMMC1484 TaxID=3404122 RepID=UPI003BF5C758
MPAQGAPETPEPAVPTGRAGHPDAPGPRWARDVPQRRPGGSEEQRAGPAPAPDGPPPGYQRSLAYSGLAGLVISVVGLVMVGSRRRYW